MADSPYEQRKKELGKLIRERRRDLKMSGEVLADRLTTALPGDKTVGQTAVSYWETGRSAPEATKFRAIEVVLGLPAGTVRAVLEAQPLPPAMGLATPRALVDQMRALLAALEDHLPPEPAGEHSPATHPEVQQLRHGARGTRGTGTPGRKAR